MRSKGTPIYFILLLSALAVAIPIPTSLSTGDDPDSQVKVSTTGYISPINPNIYDLGSIATIEGHTRNAVLEGNRYKLEH